MSLFSIFRKNTFFSAEEQEQIVAAIRAAETRTSGEIRVFVESHCRFVNPVDRAAEAFAKLNMGETKDHNAVLVYLAIKDRQLAVFGDKGIHEKVGDAFWNEKVKQILFHFDRKNYAGGLVKMIEEIGEALRTHFPYDKETDINELSDDIVFGR